MISPINPKDFNLPSIIGRGETKDGRIFFIQLRDGTKITVGRDNDVGEAWLEVTQPKIAEPA